MVREIKGSLYKINIYCANPIFVEVDNLNELFTYIAEKVFKGSVIQSVNKIEPNGKTPKIPIFTDKEYKKIYKEISSKSDCRSFTI